MDEHLVRAFPFLKTLPESARLELVSRSVAMTLAHRQVLVHPGSECVWLPFVVQGALRIYKTGAGREITLYRIEKGESCILSATCILNGSVFPAVAEAEGETEIFLVPAALIDRFVDEHAAWRRFVFSMYSKRLETVLSLVEEVAFHHVDARIAAYLVKTAAPRARTVTRTHSEIAAEVGTSREVVSRILKDFEAAGFVAVSRGRVRIVNHASLAERAETGPGPDPRG